MKSSSSVIIFASGSGTNAEKIIDFLNESPCGAVAAVFTNNENAGVIDRAKARDVEVFTFTRSEFNETDLVLQKLKDLKAEVIALAGFLLKVPDTIIQEYQGRIVNLHPALLPKFGGEGMYGMKVHQAVLDAGEQVSGITIHLVDKDYDTGKKLFQARVAVEASDTPKSLAQKVQELEHRYYPRVVEALCNQK